MKVVRLFGKLAFLLCLFAASTAPAFAQSPELQTGSTPITTPSDALAQDSPSGSKTDKPSKSDPSNPRVTDVSPSYGPTDTQVTIRANVRLDGATEVVWGGHRSKVFSVQKDGSIITAVPIGGFPAATTVPVTVILDNVMLPTDSMFTIPIGEADIIGPGPFVPGDESDYFWFNGGGRVFQLGPSGTILTSDPKPVFYLTTAFVGSGNVYSPDKAPFAAGNAGRFQVMLYMCDVGNDVPELRKKGFASCKNWDGYEGASVPIDDQCAPYLGGSWTAHLLPSWNPRLLRYDPKGVTSDRIALNLAPCFDEKNLARSFSYEVRVEQDQIPGMAGFPARIDTKNSPAFNVVIPPAAMLQVNVIPYTILYAPPGNQSIVSFSATETYSTQFSIANSKSVDNKSTTSQSSSMSFADSFAFFLGFSGGNVDQSTNTTMKDFGTVQGEGPQGMSSAAFSSSFTLPANPATVPGSGTICTSIQGANCLAKAQTPNMYALEPFWDDVFVLLVHPQFAVWVIGGKADRYQMYGAEPVLAERTVSQLDACATGSTVGIYDPCTVEYSDSQLTLGKHQNVGSRGVKGKLKLSAAEAKRLLALDPFYAGGQGAEVDVSKRANQIGPGRPYGASFNSGAVPYEHVFTNTDQLQLNQNAEVSYTTAISTMYGSTTSTGLTASLSSNPGYPGGGGTPAGGDTGGGTPDGGATGGGAPEGGGTLGGSMSLTIQSQDQLTYETDIKLTYQNSTAVSQEKVTSATVSLNDISTCTGCHGPLMDQPSVNIYLDRVFGSFMFQDPYAPKGYSRDKVPKCCAMLINSLVQEETANPRFSDVAATNPEIGVIGFLALAGILPGNTDGTFKPDDPLTREQLAVALTRAANLPEHAGTGKFADVPAERPNAAIIEAATAANLVVPRSATQFGSDDPVTQTDLAGALSRAGLTKTAGTSSPQPTGSLTRAEAARMIFMALPNR